MTGVEYVRFNLLTTVE